MRSFLLLPALLALPAYAEQSLSPLELARALPSEGPLYAFDMEYISTDITARGKIDPSQPEGSRINISFPAKEDWPDDFEDGLKEMDAEADGDIWCAGMLDAVPDGAELVSEDNGIARYAFKPSPAEKRDEKFMKHLSGTIEIDSRDGAVLAFAMTSSKAFKPNMMVKINSFAMSATCERGPDGRTYTAETTVKVSGSAAMQSFDETETRKITALYAID